MFLTASAVTAAAAYTAKSAYPATSLAAFDNLSITVFAFTDIACAAVVAASNTWMDEDFNTSIDPARDLCLILSKVCARKWLDAPTDCAPIAFAFLEPPKHLSESLHDCPVQPCQAPTFGR